MYNNVKMREKPYFKLFKKVTNQLVNVCKEYLSEMSVVHNNEEFFWPTIFKEIEENYNSLSSNEDNGSNINLNSSVNIFFYL